ncbi:hypothetical protein ACHAW5_004249 [Stephanodiscus triporus]|uniref:GATA-type domain-containing protein n=1 Tax=Stephanodiscus triporus TaxID=2934178 RepID=A0ABD3PH29_9STRA
MKIASFDERILPGRIHVSVEASSPDGKRHKGPSRSAKTTAILSSYASRRSQSIHRTLSHVLDDDAENLKLLELSSTLSEGKMILNDLSINSSYSAEFADLCGPSPANANYATRIDPKTMNDDGSSNTTNDRTPKKRNNTRERWRRFIETGVATPRVQSVNNASAGSALGHDESPTMFDLIGGDETPTTGMLMNSIIMEAAMTDDLRSLNGHLRGQSFTPLPMMAMGDRCERGGTNVGGLDGNAGHSQVDSVGDSPQLSWNTTDGDSPLEINTPRFSMLDSTKSGRSYATFGSEGRAHPLGSPKSFWTDDIPKRKEGARSGRIGQQGEIKSILSLLSPTMREMNVASHSGSDLEGDDQSPLPLYHGDQHSQENHDNDKSGVNTPLRRPPIPNKTKSSPYPISQAPHSRPVHMQSSPWGNYRSGVPSGGFANSPIPHSHHHPHGAASPYPDCPPPFHQGMYNPTAHHPHAPPYNPNDRVRNLRGNGPPRHQLPPQHHLPPPSYHHFSPLTNVMSGGRVGRHGGYLLPNHLDMLSSSKRKCLPIKPPIPSKFQGDFEACKDAQIPEFNNLVNFPGHMSNKPCPNMPDGMRCCVMCGQACPTSTSGKITKKVSSYIGGSDRSAEEARGGTAGSSMGGGNGVAPLGNSAVGNNNKVGCPSPSLMSSGAGPHASSSMSSCASNYASIPTQNKGLCTICDVNVWIVTSSGLEIKWCKGCKNFRPWAAFGDKGLATKCVRCRERQREKYALQKEEKDKKKLATKTREQGHQQQQQVRQAASSGDLSSMSCNAPMSSDVPLSWADMS